MQSIACSPVYPFQRLLPSAAALARMVEAFDESSPSCLEAALVRLLSRRLGHTPWPQQSARLAVEARHLVLAPDRRRRLLASARIAAALRDRGILVGSAKVDAAGLLAAYALGLTHVDSVAFALDADRSVHDPVESTPTLSVSRLPSGRELQEMLHGAGIEADVQRLRWVGLAVVERQGAGSALAAVLPSADLAAVAVAVVRGLELAGIDPFDVALLGRMFPTGAPALFADDSAAPLVAGARASCADDWMAVIALHRRDVPRSSRDLFVHRALQDWWLALPAADRALRSTRGVPLFQEQTLEILKEVFGYSGADACAQWRAWQACTDSTRCPKLESVVRDASAKRCLESLEETLRVNAAIGFRRARAASMLVSAQWLAHAKHLLGEDFDLARGAAWDPAWAACECEGVGALPDLVLDAGSSEQAICSRCEPRPKEARTSVGMTAALAADALPSALEPRIVVLVPKALSLGEGIGGSGLRVVVLPETTPYGRRHREGLPDVVGCTADVAVLVAPSRADFPSRWMLAESAQHLHVRDVVVAFLWTEMPARLAVLGVRPERAWVVYCIASSDGERGALRDLLRLLKSTGLAPCMGYERFTHFRRGRSGALARLRRSDDGSWSDALRAALQEMQPRPEAAWIHVTGSGAHSTAGIAEALSVDQPIDTWVSVQNDDAVDSPQVTVLWLFPGES